ncbi:hypothetical protein F2Q68_00011360 [Brassica cretica]|uniref:Arabidopsis retrotransposon Orf1 C-terminal domain-containing protein n=1 Tax=Brassica cretica TaxID=69181 RepID=A0A8S9KNT8_BRACR|nr:hypothetical protein F2Q68_00011360 [Brassica cretica]
MEKQECQIDLKRKKRIIFGWKPPPISWLKCEIGSAWDKDRNQSGASWILSNADGKVQMGRKDQQKMEAEKQELARQETARHGKSLSSVSTLGGTSRSAHSKRSKEPKGKGVALTQEEENEDITEEDQAPHKRAKVSKGKKVDTERDRTMTPTEDELYGHLKNGVSWPPTRFADIKIMEELEIGYDIKQMLEHMNIPSFFTVAYPTYEDESCQFLSSLVATFHTAKHVRQGWGKIKFKIHGKVYNMTFKEIGQALGPVAM